MIRSTFSSWREYLTPVTHKSTFRETGEITPEEFVAAGDYLVYKFPTWQWSPAAPHKKRDFLPDDKQVLVTRQVPSYVRAESYLGVDQIDATEDVIKMGDDDDDDDEGWTATNILPLEIINKSTEPKFIATEEAAESIKDISSEEDYDDIDDLIDETAEGEEDDDNNNNNNNNNHNDDDTMTEGERKNKHPNKRTYDLYISYSTSYRVPKMYLVGFNSNGSPLSPLEMFEDIVPDYRHKTATIEKAPFLSNTTAVSIHPCKHASVMKVLMARAALALRKKKLDDKIGGDQESITKGVSKLGLLDADETTKALTEEETDDTWESVTNESINDDPIIRVDQYLIIFLKFISSVTPGIEHDYTMDAF